LIFGEDQANLLGEFLPPHEDDQKREALHLSVKVGLLQCVKTLLSARVSVTHGMIFDAVQQRRRAILELLLQTCNPTALLQLVTTKSSQGLSVLMVNGKIFSLCGSVREERRPRWGASNVATKVDGAKNVQKTSWSAEFVVQSMEYVVSASIRM